MSDLKRWSEEGATESEVAAMDRFRARRPTSKARARALGAALGVSASLSATSAAATGGIGLIAKLIGIGVIALGVAAVGLGLRARHQVPEPPSAPMGAIATIAEAPPEPPPDLSATAIASVDAVAPAAPASVDAPDPQPSSMARAPASKASASPPSLAGEISSLEKAYSANDPDATLKALDRYHAKFPKGALSAEESVLRVQALLSRGDVAKAAALANAFSAAHPESPFARRMQELVLRAKSK